MRMNLPVTGREYIVPPDVILVSSTDLKSRITHCNRAFVEGAGALLGLLLVEHVGRGALVVRDGRARVILRRETVDDLLSLEVR